MYNRRILPKAGEIMKRLLIFLILIALCISLLPSALAEDTLLQQDEKYAVLSALMEADIATVREAILCGLISCEELTAFYLERIETYNEPYNCFITICDDALEQARERDRQLAEGNAEGSMFGIPIVVKDNIHVAGYYTTNGEKFSKSEISTKTATVVQNLIDEGAIILAKANMSYRANRATSSISRAAGEVKNAYNIYLSPGGSSGGSAAATALNFCMAGLGTDTRSSLRIPAALNGCVALRTTVGLLKRDNIIIVASRRDTPGAITRTVRDQAILLDAMVGGCTYEENLNPNVLEGMRIGILTELADRSGNKEIKAAFANAVEELRACGAEVIEVSLPKIFTLMKSTDGQRDAALFDEFNRIYEQWLRDNNIRAVIFPSYLNEPVYTGTDANGVKWDPDEQSWINNAPVLSPCTQCPEITVPIGFHSRGAGIGMEIAALRGQEQLLLDIAYSYTLRYDHREAPEAAADLYADYHVSDLDQLISDYQAGIWPVPPTEPTTEPSTEPTTEPTTAPTTVPPTQATEATEIPATTVPTVVVDPVPKGNDQLLLYAGGGIAAAMIIAVPTVILLRRKKKTHSEPILQ